MIVMYKGGGPMSQSIPIRDLKNTGEISEFCRTTREPIFATKNGYGDMVVMSMETYEKQVRRLDIYSKLATAEEQIKTGRTMSVEASIQDLRGSIAYKLI